MSLLGPSLPPNASVPTKLEAPRPSSSPTKTPISSLQELCQHMGKTPQYDLMAMEGRAHQPQFVYRCTVGDIMRNGQGGSKKAAKHAAAESVLTVLKSGGDISQAEEEPVTNLKPQAAISQESVADSLNPVGTLQELVVARGWRLPVYSLYAESGPAHKKEFIMCCTVESFKEFGSGTAKKHAKRAAATKMYNKILALPPDAEPRHDIEIKGKPVAFDVLHNSNGEKLQPIPLDGTLGINVCQYLQQIAEKTNFSIEYFDIQEFTSNGTFQCMVMLTTQPSICTHGEGANCDEAHASAARHAIKMLMVFFQRMSKREEVKKETEEK